MGGFKSQLQQFKFSSGFCEFHIVQELAVNLYEEVFTETRSYPLVHGKVDSLVPEGVLPLMTCHLRKG